MRQRFFDWMNDHFIIAFIILTTIGLGIHYAYEKMPHGYSLLKAAMVVVGAGIAGLAVDLLFTKGEEEAGEID